MKQTRSYRGILKNIVTYRHNSILIRNFGLVMLMMILPLMIITMIVKSNMEKTVEQEIWEANDNTLYTTGQTLDGILDKMFSFSYYLAENSDFTLLYMSPVEEVLEDYQTIYDKQVRLNLLIEEYIDSVYIYLEPYDTVLASDKSVSNPIMSVQSLEQLRDQTWLSDYELCKNLDKKQESYVLGARIKEELYPYLMTMTFPVQAGVGYVRGAIVINVDMRKLSKQLGYRDRNQQLFYMIGPEGEMYYTNQEQLIENGEDVPAELAGVLQGETIRQAQIEGKNYIVSVMQSENREYRYVLCTPAERYESRVAQVNRLVRNMILMALVLGGVVAYVVTIHSFAPIQKIMGEISNPEAPSDNIGGDGGVGVKDNEIQYIIGMVQDAMRRNSKFYLETQNWINKLNNAQMVALQSQINPHYLYNTLDMINWRAVELLGRPNSVSDMIANLANFFRIGLQRDSYLIRVREEVEHAKLYASILEVRYGGSIHVTWEIGEEILDCKIIRLTLQPLIENAIHHGFRPKRYEGNVRVEGGCMEDILFLTVEDDGVGMSEEQCMAMNRELMDDYETDSSHVGIRNVNQRIKILFGEEYGVNLRQNDTGGLKVRMILPKNV